LKVFVVTKGEYSDYGIIGVCSTKEKAEELKKLTDSDEIVEWPIDEFPDHPADHYWYMVVMDKNGNTNRIDTDKCDRIDPNIEYEK
jgi:hypothetical protein